MGLMKHVKKSSKTGRFVSVLLPKTKKDIRKLASDYTFTLPQVAKLMDVDLDTVLRHRGERLTKRQLQRIYFEDAKQNRIRPLVMQMASKGLVVTVEEIRRRLSSGNSQNSVPSKTIVSKALQALADEGLVFKRPPEYHRALKKKRASHEASKPIDKKIISLRREFPNMRDQELAKKAGIGYWELRRRVTALKKAGKLPKKKRAYSTSK